MLAVSAHIMGSEMTRIAQNHLDRFLIGGFLGATLAQAMRYGVARGIFSNESGLGSAGIAAAAAQTKEPVRQALVSMTQTFIDTIVVCTMTGLVLILTGAWDSGKPKDWSRRNKD